MENNKRFYPIGSIVMTKRAERPVLIFGRLVMEEESNNKIYDYVGVDYVVGFETPDKLIFFDRDDIIGPLFMGMQGPTELEVQEQLMAANKDELLAERRATDANE